MTTSHLTCLTMILWSGMVIISGSIWVLTSQVSKLAEILEGRANRDAGGISTQIGQASRAVAVRRFDRRSMPRALERISNPAKLDAVTG